MNVEARRTAERASPDASQMALSGKRLGAAVIIWIVLAALAGGLTYFTSKAAGHGSVNQNTLAALITAEAYLLLVAALLLTPGSWSRAVQVYGLNIRPNAALLGLLVGGALSTALLLAYSLLGEWGPLKASLIWIGRDGGRLGFIDPATTAISLLRGTVLAALGEELMFRGALFDLLRRRLPAWTTIAGTALLWTAIHFGVPSAMPYAFVLGLGLGWVRERTGSVVPGLLFHVLHNTLLFAGVYLLVGWR